jgi:uncharacterized surface protein with fasciclin (FAS1) repeats
MAGLLAAIPAFAFRINRPVRKGEMHPSRIVVGAAIATALLVSGCGSDKNKADDAATTTTTAPKTVVDAAAYDADLATFATALNAAGAITTLSGKGPYIVLAPTNDAFAKLPAGQLTGMLGAKDKTKLRALLDAHIITGDELAAGKVKTVSGETLTVTQDGESFTITAPDGKAVTVGAPIVAGNGRVYPVDGFLANA